MREPAGQRGGADTRAFLDGLHLRSRGRRCVSQSTNFLGLSEQEISLRCHQVLQKAAVWRPGGAPIASKRQKSCGRRRKRDLIGSAGHLLEFGRYQRQLEDRVSC
jgi:hypothetical protein